MNNQKYLIWSNEHGSWWKPARHGYTDNIKEAGHYDHSEALEICMDANINFTGMGTPNEIPVSSSDADNMWNWRLQK